MRKKQNIPKRTVVKLFAVFEIEVLNSLYMAGCFFMSLFMSYMPSAVVDCCRSVPGDSFEPVKMD